MSEREWVIMARPADSSENFVEVHRGGPECRSLADGYAKAQEEAGQEVKIVE